MNQKRVLQLLKELVNTNSENPPGKEDDVAKVLCDHMEAHGIGCVSVGPSKRPNLIFSTHEDEKGPLVFHGHMDTVPIGELSDWSHNPFAADVHDGKLYGRGSCDMKGPVAALTETMIQYNDEGHETPLLLLCTSDEESGCSGAEEVAASGILDGVKFGVCAEPTSLGILVGEKGMLWSRVMAKGKSAHGSRPEEGINAISLCIDALDLLVADDYEYEEDALMGEMTINIGMIEGGIKINVVPSECRVQLDMRLVKGQTPDNVIKEMQQRIVDGELSDFVSIEYIHGKPAVYTSPDTEIVKIAQNAVESVTGRLSDLKAATYGTDCSVLQPKIGIMNIICGPGSIERAHQPDEYIRLSELYHAVEIYSLIAKHFDSSLK